jgi:hypothetical protein
MPNRDPIPEPDTEGPRGPSATPGLPDRGQEKPPVPPIIKPSDDVNPNDPPLGSVSI